MSDPCPTCGVHAEDVDITKQLARLMRSRPDPWEEFQRAWDEMQARMPVTHELPALPEFELPDFTKPEWP